jgi:hypothetical protein
MVAVSLPFLSLRHAYETNLVEANQRVLPADARSVRVKIGPFGVVTLRLAADL